LKATHLIKGEGAESIAATFLEKNQCVVVDKNFTCRFGEIDLICRDAKDLVFVEVRYRSNLKFGSAAETVNIAKQRKIIKAAQHFLQLNPKLNKFYMRFDVIGVDANHSIEWIKGAFLTT
jgi:putative endonuclease